MTDIIKKSVMATCTGSLPLPEYRTFKSYAALEGLKIADAVALAMREWIAARDTAESTANRGFEAVVMTQLADQSEGE